MTPTATDPVSHYDAMAAPLFERHRAVAFDAVHARLKPYLPGTPIDVLDVGAGSGRDAVALAGMGHRVVAAEPSRAFLDAARAPEGGRTVCWVEDRLPDLHSVRALGRRYDLILCSAVLMHVVPSALGAAMGTMRDLLVECGIVVTTVRTCRWRVRSTVSRSPIRSDDGRHDRGGNGDRRTVARSRCDAR